MGQKPQIRVDIPVVDYVMTSVLLSRLLGSGPGSTEKIISDQLSFVSLSSCLQLVMCVIEAWGGQECWMFVPVLPLL
jgi:hypothetical protein